MPTTLLPTTNTVLADIVRTSVFECSIGAPLDDMTWATVAPLAVNGNSFSIVPQGDNAITLKAGAVFLPIPPSFYSALVQATDRVITSAAVPPVLSRNFAPGVRTVMSEDPLHNEVPFLIANKYNHVIALDGLPQLQLAIVATDSADFPGDLIPLQTGGGAYSYIGVVHMSSDQKLSFIKNEATMVNLTATVSPLATPFFVNWKKATELVFTGTNALQVQFDFPAGTATGKFGEFALKLNGKIIGYKAITPQLYKDADVPVQVFWSIVFGAPLGFL